MNQLNGKTARTTMSWDGVTGEITMTQQSPYDVTTMTVDFSGVRVSLYTRDTFCLCVCFV